MRPAPLRPATLRIKIERLQIKYKTITKTEENQTDTSRRADKAPAVNIFSSPKTLQKDADSWDVTPAIAETRQNASPPTINKRPPGEFLSWCKHHRVKG